MEESMAITKQGVKITLMGFGVDIKSWNKEIFNDLVEGIRKGSYQLRIGPTGIYLFSRITELLIRRNSRHFLLEAKSASLPLGDVRIENDPVAAARKENESKLARTIWENTERAVRRWLRYKLGLCKKSYSLSLILPSKQEVDDSTFPGLSWVCEKYTFIVHLNPEALSSHSRCVIRSFGGKLIDLHFSEALSIKQKS
jgi:hypothetical protein